MLSMMSLSNLNLLERSRSPKQLFFLCLGRHISILHMILMLSSFTILHFSGWSRKILPWRLVPQQVWRHLSLSYLDPNTKSGGGGSKYILEKKKRMEPNPSKKIAGLGGVDVSPFPFGDLFRFQPFVFRVYIFKWCCWTRKRWEGLTQLLFLDDISTFETGQALKTLWGCTL